ncbi:MAG: hypothetical protein ACAH83_00340 [Alphaproteobacteria bacterium]
MTQTGTDFNNSAESKVIKYTELVQKLDALYESELSLAERIYQWTLDPISSLLASAAFAYDSHKGKLSAELWRGEDNTAYISAATFYAQRDYHQNFAFNKRISAKTWALGEQVLQECEDQTGSPAFLKARAVF